MAESKTVDASLWWDSFTLLLTELENSSVSENLPQNLEKKLKLNHSWFLDSVSLFKPPNGKSKEALNLQKLQIGIHQLTIQPQLKDKALQISSYLQLDEVQSYILAERSVKQYNVAVDSFVEECLPMLIIQYYMERQCLLKCIRWILMHAIYIGPGLKDHIIKEEAGKLFQDGIEGKLISLFQDLLSSSYPEQMDVDHFTLWAEEILIEENLVLDILFLAYYDSFCTCSGEKWKKYCLLYKEILCGHYNFGKLAITSEAQLLSYHIKVQLLLILIETLDLENLLQMVHDETPYRKGVSSFTMTDVQEMDALVSSFSAFEMKEAGPLILAWAVFLCLLQTLPGKDENDELTEIDHIGYVRRAFELASLSYCLEFLQCDILKEYDGPVTGYCSVLRTLISAFVASYEINFEPQNSNPALILDILCTIYRGEESLCVQFWDKESFIDGPIRSLLCNLESEFPFRAVEFVRLLSSLCEGTWPAECVYNFLDKAVGVSSLVEISSGSVGHKVSYVVEAQQPVRVPGIEGLVIPVGTRGRVVKVFGENSALVRWEYESSGVLLLLLHLAQEKYLNSNDEVVFTLDLLSRLLSFNTALCFALMDISNSVHFLSVAMVNKQKEKNYWVVEMICNLVRNLSTNSCGAAIMSMGVKILGELLICSPSIIKEVALNANIFDIAVQTTEFSIGSDGLSSGSWLLSGKLAKMLLIDCEQNSNDWPLAISVLDFTIQLVETRVENDALLALIIFSLQYVLVNHQYWKYKMKHIRWKITLKVLELMKKCIISISYYGKMGEIIRDVVFSDSSIHSTLFQIACTTANGLEKLHVSRLFDPMEIEGLQLTVGSALDILCIMLTKLSKDYTSPSFSVFHQAVFSCTTKSVSIVTAAISLISYFRDPAIQFGAARVLSVIFAIADISHPFLYGNTCFVPDDKQIMDVRRSLSYVLLEQSVSNEDLFVATVNLLVSAARYQPAFLAAVFASEEKTDDRLSLVGDVKQQKNETSFEPLDLKKSCLLDAILHHLDRADDLIKSNPRILLSILDFMVALWQGAPQYANFLESLRSSKFWKHLSNAISEIADSESPLFDNLTEKDATTLAYSYHCQSAILGILAYELFLQKKLLHAESLVKDVAETKDQEQNAIKLKKFKAINFVDLEEILLSWCKDSVLQKLIKSYTTCGHINEAYHRAKVATSLFTIHVMEKLVAGDSGSLSVSFHQKIDAILTKLSTHPAFSELLSQYSQRGYSEGKELRKLILSDLYYHLQGELEGRKIGIGPFKELSQGLVELSFLGTYQHNFSDDLSPTTMNVYLFDLIRLRADLGFDVWECSDWKASKEIAETMLRCLQNANSVMLLSKSKLSASKALIAVLAVYPDESLERNTMGEKLSDALIFPCIDNICQSFQAMVKTLASALDASEDTLEFLASQAELLLQLTRTVWKNLSLDVSLLVLKCAASVLKLLSELRLLPSRANLIMKLLLTLLLLVLECNCLNSQVGGSTDEKSAEDFSKISNATLGLLPILCNCIAASEHCKLSLSVMDLILKSFLTPSTWLPIIQNHLQLQLVMLKLQDRTISSIPVVMKFFLTLARVKEGAEMLYCSGFLSSLKVLFTETGQIFLRIHSENMGNSNEKFEMPQDIWGLGLAVVTAMIQSLRDGSSCIAIVDSMIPYFFSEKAYLIFNSLNAPDLPSDDHDKKRPRAPRSWISFAAIKETEHTLILMCELVKHWNSWIKAIKEVDRQLREKCIHLLAFISRGTHRLGELSGRNAPLLCPPTLKEDFDCCSKPSYINSRNGWFALSPLGCASKSKITAVSSALTIYGQATESSDCVSKTSFSDIVALQIYRIAFFLLKFLCLQAEGAAKRAEEVGFVDLAHFPELPMPEILHGLQDQAISIVTELCEANKLKVSTEIQDVCIMLLQIMEMALHLELCVLQICGIRPVSGRVEDFSKEVKALFGALEGHAFLKASKKSLKQIILFLYPGLLQGEGFM